MSDALALISQAEDPLRLGLRLAVSMPRREQRAFLVNVLTRFGQHWRATTAREIERLAADLYTLDPSGARWLLTALPAGSAPAADLLRAGLLEAAGQAMEAAAVLAAIPDPTWGEERAVRLLAQARALAKGGAIAESWSTLREAAKAARSYRSLSAVDRLLHRLPGAPVIPLRRARIALVGSTTLDFWLPALRALCLASGIEAEVYIGAFGQFQQEILDPHSALAAFAPQIVILATDWRALGLADEVTDSDGAAQVSMLRDLWRRCRDRWGAFVIQHNFEVPVSEPYGRLSAALSTGRGRVLRRINLDLWEAEQEEAGVAILDVEQTAAGFGKEAWEDPVLWYTARQYPAPEATVALVRRQVALLRAILGLSRKGLVLDLDGVLWGGVISEDGLGGIVLGGSGAGEAYVEFQRYIRALGQRGVILAVCSKNNEEEAKLPFRAHPEMALSLDDISLFVANWQPKDQNLRQVAATLNIGLDSLVFVDDSPLERAWVRQQLPEVAVPELPADPAFYVRALDQEAYFEALSLTEEDRHRGEAYRADAQRQALQAASGSLEEFLASLQMRIELKPFDEANLPRIVQLINKTNQFNLTTRRLTESEIRRLMAREGCYTQAMRLQDCFGDSGLTGVLIALAEGDSLRIDTWLLSCRVLGRQVERAMMASLMRYGRDCGYRYLLGEYLPTAKNAQVRDLFERLGFALVHEGPQGERTYRWDLWQGLLEAPGHLEIDDRTQRRTGVASRCEVIEHGNNPDYTPLRPARTPLLGSASAERVS